VAFMRQSKNILSRVDSMEQNFVEALTVRIENQLIAVLNAKQLPSDRRAKQALLNGVGLSGQFAEFVIVEKFDAVSDELIAVDIEKATLAIADLDSLKTNGSDLTFELAAAAMGKLQLKGGSKAVAICNFLHRPSGLQALVQNHAGTPYAFEVTLLRMESERTSLRDLELKHAYLESATVKISTPEGPTVQASLLAAYEAVYSESGKSVVVALRGDSLSGSKKRTPSQELNAAAQQALNSLVKHIAASLHIAQATVQVLLIWPSQEADFRAAEWVFDSNQSMLKTNVSAGGLVALAELASAPGSVAQGIARVLPGVPTRIAHAGGIVEIMATTTGVTRTVRVLPVGQGKLFSHSN
jgi:hypothetical protein